MNTYRLRGAYLDKTRLILEKIFVYSLVLILFLLLVFAKGTKPECNDGLDNDGDSYIDLNDKGCKNKGDNSESNCGDLVCSSTEGRSNCPADCGIYVYKCNDQIDNDLDEKIDYPADPGCNSLTDDDEFNQVVNNQTQLAACNDKIDNDLDEKIDYPADPGCSSYSDDNEKMTDPLNYFECDDGRDNDNDGFIDYPFDSNCYASYDANESLGPQCDDLIDNDGDGKIDYFADPGCSSLKDDDETNPQCNDAIDNDNDGFIDYPLDTGCYGLVDSSEKTNSYQCDDDFDNDFDGKVDYPFDSDCTSPSDATEGDSSSYLPDFIVESANFYDIISTPDNLIIKENVNYGETVLFGGVFKNSGTKEATYYEGMETRTELKKDGVVISGGYSSGSPYILLPGEKFWRGANVRITFTGQVCIDLEADPFKHIQELNDESSGIDNNKLVKCFNI